MAIIKCKMCGGDLNISDESVAVCEYCGTQQTVPSADSEKKLALFGRANRLRLSNEFDKAAGVYESIVAEFPEEAEAYWGLVLCRYGIEYVDDPATGKKIPTCHRSSFESVLEDSDFEQACENADAVARKVYREEAKAIEELRRDILEVSGKEEPYDIFICYKESDDKGERTIDSVIAQDVYEALTDKGYRVFFSRISLEDKLGAAYEPYIFAALNSAKVMLAFGTDYEYFNAVWVKNEWSRFLALIAAGQKKTLIPCYKGIDAYDLPKEFAKLQAQDMGKVGATQDLLRGIDKIMGRGQGAAVKKETVVQQVVSGPTAESLLHRGELLLEDHDWDEAETYFNKVLDINAELAEAYLGLLRSYLQVADKNALGEKYAVQFLEEAKKRIPRGNRARTVVMLQDLPDYQKALRYGSAEMQAYLRTQNDVFEKKLGDYLLPAQAEAAKENERLTKALEERRGELDQLTAERNQRQLEENQNKTAKEETVTDYQNSVMGLRVFGWIVYAVAFFVLLNSTAAGLWIAIIWFIISRIIRAVMHSGANGTATELSQKAAQATEAINDLNACIDAAQLECEQMENDLKSAGDQLDGLNAYVGQLKQTPEERKAQSAKKEKSQPSESRRQKSAQAPEPEAPSGEDLSKLLNEGCGDLKTVEAMLKNGQIDLNEPVSLEGQTAKCPPLLWLLFSEQCQDLKFQKACVQLLLDHGADPNAPYTGRANDGTMVYATVHSAYALIASGDENYCRDLATLLLERGADHDAVVRTEKGGEIVEEPIVSKLFWRYENADTKEEREVAGMLLMVYLGDGANVNAWYKEYRGGQLVAQYSVFAAIVCSGDEAIIEFCLEDYHADPRTSILGVRGADNEDTSILAYIMRRSKFFGPNNYAGKLDYTACMHIADLFKKFGWQ